jgi:hypothetical protein
MFSNKKRRRIKPFARPTSFDFNAVFDLRHYQTIKYGATPADGERIFKGSTSVEDFQIMEGEILMHRDESKAVRRYGDHQMHCFGFAAGLLKKTETPVSDTSQMHKDALGQLKYAGVAVTGFKPETDIYEQGFVVTVAGLNTIFNNGEHNIYPGDLICADVPRVGGLRANNRANAQGGIPGTKFQFTVTPYDKMLEAVGQELASKFIMGTAMSFSKKGSPLDVVLHRCNVITIKEHAKPFLANESKDRVDNARQEQKKNTRTKKKSTHSN